MIGDEWDAVGRERTWRRHCTQPTHRPAKAMRELLGLKPYRAAQLAGIRFDHLGAFETGTLEGQHWPYVATRLDAAYRAMGARWCEPDLHEGAFLVRLVESFADSRRAILAAVALMGHTAGRNSRKVTVGQLLKRVGARSGLPADQLRRAISGKDRMPDRIAKACFRQLGEGRDGAGYYFEGSLAGGWSAVGCDYAGCWW